MSDKPPGKDTGRITVPRNISAVGSADPTKRLAATVRREIDAALAPTEFAPAPASQSIPAAYAAANKPVVPKEDPFTVEMLARARDFKQLIDSLEFQGSTNRSPELTLRFAQLYLSACDAKSAHKVLQELFEYFKEKKINLTFKQASDGLWFILKAIRTMPVNEETEKIFQDAVDLCEEISQRFAPAVFREVRAIVPLLLGMREGLKRREMSYYDDVIRKAKSLDSRGNKRIEAERLRIIGSAHLHKILSVKAIKEEELSHAQKVEELNRATEFTKSAIAILEQLEQPLFFEQEGGELLRTRDNLVRSLIAAAANMEDKSAIDAKIAIEKAIGLARDTGNLLVAARLRLACSDLLRFDGFRSIEPAEDELKMAHDELLEAQHYLNLLSDDRVKDTIHIDIDLLWENSVYVQLNLSIIEYRRGMRRQARMDYEIAEGFIKNIRDARLRTAAEIDLKQVRAECPALFIDVEIMHEAHDSLYAAADAIAKYIVTTFFRSVSLEPGQKIVVMLQRSSSDPTQFMLRTNIEGFHAVAVSHAGILGNIVSDKLRIPRAQVRCGSID